MKSPQTTGQSTKGKEKQDARRERLAQALRANLAKRKQQQRARIDHAGDNAAKPETSDGDA